MFIIIVLLTGALAVVTWGAWRLRKNLIRLNERVAAVSGLLVGIARTHKKSGQFTIPVAIVTAIPDWVIQSAPNPNGSIKVQVLKVGK